MGQRVGLLAGLLVLTLASGVVAQDPSASTPPWFGGRVEMLAQGLAIEFPEEWVVFDITADTDAQVDVVIEESADELFPDLDALRGDLAWRSTQGSELLALLPSVGMCALDIVPLPASQILDPGFFQDFEGVIRADESILAFEGIERIDLPGGPGITYEWSTDDPSTGALVTRHTGFMIGGEAQGAMLVCEGWERPDDRWLSIAETFAFLPAEE